MSSDDATRPEGSPSEEETPSSEVTPTANTPTVGRRDAVREKAQQVRVQQSRARLLRRGALLGGAVVVVGALGVGVAWAIGAAMSRPQLTPSSTDADGFTVSSIASASTMIAPDDTSAATTTPTAEPAPTETQAAAEPVRIHVYVDFLAPAAREWQLANAPQLSTWVTDGAATLTYHPVSMLTAKSNGTKYSLRAASAAACVATYSPASFFSFTNDLLTRQPTVDSDGFADSALADIALANGGDDPKKLRQCIESEAFTGWVKAATERAVSGAGKDVPLTGTSMVTVNGQMYQGDMTDPAEFSQFVLTTASGAAAKEKSATPTPTPTESATTAP